MNILLKKSIPIFTILFAIQNFSQAQCPGEVLNIIATGPSVNGITGTWLVPAGGPFNIRITAIGGSGGNMNNTGGKGAKIVGEFVVTSGQTIEAIAGAPGANSSGTYSGAGGGGGSGAQIQGGNLLLLAGGGGGASGFEFGKNASILSTGSLTIGGGGAGFDASNGGIGNAGTSSFIGVGGAGGGGGGNGGGGAGGGGGGYNGGVDGGAGGGGGYAGGSGNSGGSSGAGGGSFNSGTNQTNTVTASNSNGSVIIECLGKVVLPIQLLNFSVNSLSNSSAKIIWITADEKNFHYYQLQKSNDVNHFEVIGTIEGEKFSILKLEKNTNLHQYEFLDENFHKTTYYRLKMVDLDGSFLYSKIIFLDIDNQQNNSNSTLGEPYPKPIQNSQVSIDLITQNAGTWDINIFEANGHKQFIEKKTLPIGFNTLEIKIPTGNGIRLIEFKNSNEIFYRKVY